MQIKDYIYYEKDIIQDKKIGLETPYIANFFTNALHCKIKFIAMKFMSTMFKTI